MVTGCRLGKRALKFRDFGKMAATFCDLREDRAVRILARESAKARARELYPEMAGKNQQQMRAYRHMPDEDLFAIQWVHVALAPEDVPGYKAPRAVCAQCGEETTVPFKPTQGRPVLCRVCYKQQKTPALQAHEDDARREAEI